MDMANVTKYRLEVFNCGEGSHNEFVYDMRDMTDLSVGKLYHAIICLNFAWMIKAKILISDEQRTNDIIGWKNYTLDSSNHRMIQQSVVEQVNLFLLQNQYIPWKHDEITISRLSCIFNNYFCLKIKDRDRSERQKTLVLYREGKSEIHRYLDLIEEGVKERNFNKIIVLNADSRLAEKVKKKFNIPVECIKQMGFNEILVEISNADGYIGEASCFSRVVEIVKPQKEWVYCRILYGHAEDYKEKWYMASWNHLVGKIVINSVYEHFIEAGNRKDFNKCFSLFMNRIAELYKYGGTIAELLEEQGIKRVGIYGAGTVGSFVYQDLLRNGEIDIKYVADKNYVSWKGIEIRKLDEMKEEEFNCVDIWVITPLFLDYKDIFIDFFKKGVVVPVIAIETIVYGH